MGEPLATRKQPRAGRIRGILSLAAIALLFAAAQIRYSMDRGRLAVTPVFDDVYYFCDALDRLDAFYAKGLRGLFAYHVAHPPRSPFASYAAMTGFLLFGIHDWAPYAISTLLVLALLACGWGLMRGLGRWYQTAACLFLLTIPLSADMILEFRPDFAWGLAAALAIVLSLRRSLLDASLRYRLSVGLAFALALLCKTSTFPLTLVTVGFAWLLAAFCDRLDLGPVATIKRIARVWLQMLTPVALLALPHYLVAFHGIVAYISDNLYGHDRALWVRTGTTWFHVSYYLTGEAGQFVLRYHLWLLVLVLLIGTAAPVVRARVDPASRSRLRRVVCLAMVTLLALGIPTLNSVKSIFFGAEFQILLVLGSLLSIGMLLRGDAGRTGKLAGGAVLAIATLGGVCLFRFPDSWGQRGDAHVTANNRVVHSVAALVIANTPPGGTVFVTSAGPVSACAMKYIAREQGRLLSASSLDRSDDLSAYSTAYDSADCVVAAEAGTTEFFGFLPGTKILTQTLNLIRGRDDFDLAGSVISESGTHLFVFAKRPAFFDWDSTENLGRLEGPYPLWGLPLVRWGTGQRTVLRFHADSGGMYRLSITSAAPMEGQFLTYAVDGKAVADRRDDFPLGQVKSFSLPLQVSAGKHEIVLIYAKSLPDASPTVAGHTMLFRRLSLGARG